MTQALATSVGMSEADFQAAMIGRLRASMGELLPDAVLQQIVAKGVEEAFFKPRQEKDGWHTREKPPWLITFLQQEIPKAVEKAVKQWVADNSEVVQKQINDLLSKGVLEAVAGSLVGILRGPFGILQEELDKVWRR